MSRTAAVRLGARLSRGVAAPLISLLLACAPGAALAQANDGLRVSEQTVKAAYLYKFAGYVEWPGVPAAAGAPITIGVLGAGALAEELASITVDRSVDGRPILVRQIEPEQSFAGVDVLFIGEQTDDLAAVLATARSLPVLTVTEVEDALEEGSIVNFITNQQRIRFEISLVAAESSGLRLSSGLLAVAERVYRSIPE